MRDRVMWRVEMSDEIQRRLPMEVENTGKTILTEPNRQYLQRRLDDTFNDNPTIFPTLDKPNVRNLITTRLAIEHSDT